MLFVRLQKEIQRAQNICVFPARIVSQEAQSSSVITSQEDKSQSKTSTQHDATAKVGTGNNNVAPIFQTPWTLLFASATPEFFQRHCRYVQIDISAFVSHEQRIWLVKHVFSDKECCCSVCSNCAKLFYYSMLPRFGWCESRLRMLVSALEQVIEVQLGILFVEYLFLLYIPISCHCWTGVYL